MIKNNDEYLDSNKFKSILIKYEQAKKANEDIWLEADDFTDIAQYYSMLDKWDEAEEAISKGLSLHPGAVSPLAFKSRIALIQHNDPKKADEYAEMIIDKSDLDYYYIKAEILIAQDKIKESERYLHECFDNISPDNYEDFIIDVANIYSDYEKYDEAKKWLSNYKDIDSSDYKELMVRISINTGDFDNCKYYLERLLDENPYCIKYWNILSAVQLTTNDIEGSISSSEYAIAIDPEDADAIKNKAEALYRQDNFEEALKLYDKYSVLQHDDFSNEQHIGMCYFKLCDFDNAIPHLKKAIKVITEDINNGMCDPFELNHNYQELILALIENKHGDEAIGYLDDMDKSVTNTTDKIDSLILRGHTYMFLHKHIRDAYSCFKKAMDLSNSSPAIIFHIAVSAYDNGYLHFAYKYYKILFKAVKDTDWKLGYTHMALCCKELGKGKDFMKYLKIACDVNPDEVKEILGYMFPEDTNPEDYFNYLYNEINKKNKK